mmetsp:Transcript_14743/g.38989  ORF Transcript_14743/g.38989 Transcript_14743/m.38989 type:complete len:269 (+) Transcript_14743:667-1473(+)
MAVNRGAIMNSMKPICELGLFNLSRSLRNWTGTPRSFSLSPCWKNSSRHNSAQAWVTSHALHGLEMSHACRMAFRTRGLFSALVSTPISSSDLALSRFSSNTSWFISYNTCSSFTMAACNIMSVCNIDSMQMFRTCRRSSFDRPANTFARGSPRIVYSFAQCIFSSGDKSLYCSASSCPTSDRKPLLRPKCPTSCAMAATSSENCSSSDMKSEDPVIRMTRPTACVTSTACAKLWKGALSLGWYPICTDRRKWDSVRSCSPVCSMVHP